MTAEAVILNPAELPDRKVEAWKYTDLARYFSARSADALSTARPALSAESVEALLQASHYPDNGQRLVFIGGHYSPEHSSASVTPETSDAVHAELCAAKLWQGDCAPRYQLKLTGEHVGPLHLLFLYPRDSRQISQVQLDIQAEANQSYALIEEHLGGDAGIGLNSTRFELAEHARIQLIRLQHTDPAFTLIQEQRSTLAASAHLHQVHCEWGARLSRLDARILLNGRDASSDYYALSGLTARQHVDHQTLIEHQSPQARSHIRARGIVDGQARNVFSGKILVARGAQGTDSDQLLRNLLLSERAEVDAKPELEIYADDVRCAHGSTVGRLDDAALFYLRSRGLDHEHARRLLMLSFAEEILQHIAPAELHERTQQAFADHLHLRTSA